MLGTHCFLLGESRDVRNTGSHDCSLLEVQFFIVKSSGIFATIKEIVDFELFGCNFERETLLLLIILFVCETRDIRYLIADIFEWVVFEDFVGVIGGHLRGRTMHLIVLRVQVRGKARFESTCAESLVVECLLFLEFLSGVLEALLKLI